MSLLEDIYLQDEADEANDLERIIEGGEDIEENAELDEEDDDGEPRDDEAEEDRVRVDPTKPKTVRVVKNPRVVLNPARLTGPRGIQAINESFKNLRFKGKGQEKEDLDIILKKLEHWAYRLYPKFQFDDCLKKIEQLGKKRPVKVHLTKLRRNMLNENEEVVEQKDSSDEENDATRANANQEQDQFDVLLEEQLAKVRSTPAAKANVTSTPKPSSSSTLTEEQKQRILRNKQLAEERRLAKLRQTSDESNLNKSKSNDATEMCIHDKDESINQIINDKATTNNIDIRNVDLTSCENIDLTAYDKNGDLVKEIDSTTSNYVVECDLTTSNDVPVERDIRFPVQASNIDLTVENDVIECIDMTELQEVNNVEKVSKHAANSVDLTVENDVVECVDMTELEQVDNVKKASKKATNNVDLTVSNDVVDITVFDKVKKHSSQASNNVDLTDSNDVANVTLLDKVDNVKNNSFADSNVDVTASDQVNQEITVDAVSNCDLIIDSTKNNPTIKYVEELIQKNNASSAGLSNELELTETLLHVEDKMDIDQTPKTHIALDVTDFDDEF